MLLGVKVLRKPLDRILKNKFSLTILAETWQFQLQRLFVIKTIRIFFLFTGQPGQCLNKKAHRSAPGGSGAGGSVVIITKKLNRSPGGRIFISGRKPVKCAFGAGGGKLYNNIIYCQH